MKSVGIKILLISLSLVCCIEDARAYGDSWDDDTPTVRYDDSVYRAMKGSKLYKLALDGDVAAMRILGQKLITGNGVKKDVRNGVKWIRKAAEEESDPAAMYMFGEMYEKGKGVSKNEKKAVEWFVEAYEEGYKKAQAKIMAHPVSCALNWWEEQASSNKEAALKVITCYATGNEGVEKDTHRAKYYYNLAHDKWPQDAEALLASLPYDVRQELDDSARRTSSPQYYSDYQSNNTSKESIEEELIDAIEQGDYDAVKTLLESDVKMGNQARILLSAVSAPRHADSILQELINHGINVHAANNSVVPALHKACLRDENGAERPEVVRILLNAGADVNLKTADGETPLMFATCALCEKVVEVLLKHGADVNVWAESQEGLCRMGCRIADLDFPEKYDALTIACTKGSLNCVKSLIEAGADMNIRYNGTPLFYQFIAVPGMFEFCLEHGVNLDLTDGDGGTLLLVLCTNNKKEDLDLTLKCIKAGANTDIIDKNGISPLFCSVVFKNKKIFNALLAAKADANLKHDCDLTALHMAAGNGLYDMVAGLLEHGADVNAIGTKNEWTPLHVAAHEGHLSVVQLLVEKGADINIKAGNGNTAEQVAREAKHEDIADYLTKAARIEEQAEHNRSEKQMTIYIIWGAVGIGFLALIIIWGIARSGKTTIVLTSGLNKKRVSTPSPTKSLTTAPRLRPDNEHRGGAAPHVRHTPLPHKNTHIAPPPPPPPHADKSSDKVYMILMTDGSQNGPFSLADLRAHLQAGYITPDTLVWCQGMPDWQPAHSVMGR